jgi:cold shock CspA family protein
MKSTLKTGKLTVWKDEKGFGFIQPEEGGATVFLHISALKNAGRRPTVGDVIRYEPKAEANGKVRAANASIEGVSPQASPTQARRPAKRKSAMERRFQGLLFMIPIAAIAQVILWLGGRQNSPSAPQADSRSAPAIAQANCRIKGNISVQTGQRFYHLPGMRDYDSTTIRPEDGERWFCTEEEARSKGWSRAPG